MGRTWRHTDAEDYYYEINISKAIEAADEAAYERAYAAQCRREQALWERRKLNSDTRQAPPV
jgi:hypothetical protein